MIRKIKNMERFICEKKKKTNWKNKINLKITDWNKNTLKNVEYCNLKDCTFSLYILKRQRERCFMELIAEL